MADINPIRYRGYYLDSDSGLYYLKSRYYDPQLARFINADGIVSTGQGAVGCNMFAYCGNNPAVYYDVSGTFAISIPLLAIGKILFDSCISLMAVYAAWEIGTSIGEIISDSPRNPLTDTLFFSLPSIVTSTVAYNSRTVEQSISVSMDKSKAKVKTGSYRYRYWKAQFVDYGEGMGTYMPTVPQSYSRAISYVRAGGNVFADSRASAYILALAVGNGRLPTKPEIHGNKNGSNIGYWYHYHDGKRQGGHIFYV